MLAATDSARRVRVLRAFPAAFCPRSVALAGPVEATVFWFCGGGVEEG